MLLGPREESLDESAKIESSENDTTETSHN